MSIPELQAIDTWLLLAVAYAESAMSEANLGTVGLLAGLIQPDVLTDEGLRSALGRLQSAELVVSRDGLYHPTEWVWEFFQSRVHRRGVEHDHEDLFRLLEAHLLRETVADPK